MKRCTSCGCFLNLKVCKSQAGYYIGYWCDNCGPYERISGYYQSHETAQNALNNKDWIESYGRFNL